MINFKIEDVQYTLKDYISIQDYVKIYKIKDLHEDNYFAAKILSMVSDAPISILKECEYQDIEYLASYVMSLMPIEQPKFVDRFELDGIEYGFFPNWQSLTFAEFVDMDTISNKKSNELLDFLHILIAIMYRPIIKERSKHDYSIEEYDVDKMKERAEYFKKNLDIKYVFGAQFFFINYAKKYLNHTPSYSMQTLSTWEKLKVIWMAWRMIYKLRSSSRLGGSQSSTELQKMILRNMKQSLEKN